ncbi:unnamed protein product [Cuscuta epithymum]|uniref:Uncharacterized protein n=1 Tax=Cuscuta epithymum TaxID=186058 RepID=A0AAV0DP05_9ASTE|nr:unnamed protein product [Cuscuta epithymum]
MAASGQSSSSASSYS